MMSPCNQLDGTTIPATPKGNSKNPLENNSMECTKYPGFQEFLDTIISCQDAWIRIPPSSGYKKKPAVSRRNEIPDKPWINRACVIPCQKGPEARNLMEPRMKPNTLKLQRETGSKEGRIRLGLTSQRP